MKTRYTSDPITLW